MTKIKAHVRVNNKRKQVSIDNYIVDKLHARGYTLDSFLHQELRRVNDVKSLSTTIQKLAAEKLFSPTTSSASNNSLFKFVDLFAGIGGFRFPLEKHHGKCLGYSEIQWDSMRVYAKNYKMEDCYLEDIRNIDKIDTPHEIDLIVGGVPCQSWSSAGKNKGFDDSRGQLWLDTIRVVKANKPNCFLFENVQGLADPRHKKSLEYILQSFENIGYKTTYKVLSSRDFGLVQDRSRIFIIGFKNKINFSRFKWPKKVTRYPSLGEVLKIKNYKKKPYQLSKSMQMPLFKNSEDTNIEKINFSSHKNKFNDFFIFSDVRGGDTTLHSWDFLDVSEVEKNICLKMISLRRRLGKALYNKDGAPLSFDVIKKEIPYIEKNNITSLVSKRIFKEFDNERYDFVNSKQSRGVNGIYRVYSPDAISFPTLTATGSPDFISTISFKGNTLEKYKSYFIEEIYKKKRFRPITERETARLQGFPEKFKLCDDGFSNRQMGNAVPIPVIDALICSIKETGCLTK